MRQVKIEYENFEREENKALVAEIVLVYAWLFPVWLKTLTIAACDRNPDWKTDDAWSEAKPEYGTAYIGICTALFDRPTEEQKGIVVHELIHVAHVRVFDLIHTRLLPRYKDDNSDLHAFLEIDAKERIEEFIENMALGIVGAMSPQASADEEFAASCCSVLHETDRRSDAEITRGYRCRDGQARAARRNDRQVHGCTPPRHAEHGSGVSGAVQPGNHGMECDPDSICRQMEREDMEGGCGDH